MRTCKVLVLLIVVGASGCLGAPTAPHPASPQIPVAAPSNLHDNLTVAYDAGFNRQGVGTTLWLSNCQGWLLQADDANEIIVDATYRGTGDARFYAEHPSTGTLHGIWLSLDNRLQIAEVLDGEWHLYVEPYADGPARVDLSLTVLQTGPGAGTIDCFSTE